MQISYHEVETPQPIQAPQETDDSIETLQPKKNLKQSYRAERQGIHRLLSYPLQVQLADGDHNLDVKLSVIQGYSREGQVNPHTEPDGVVEIYFPLSGAIEATRDEETTQLTGQFDDLQQLTAQAELSISPDLTSATLTVTTTTGEPIVIPGFVIPSGATHSTSFISTEGKICRFVAIKVAQADQPAAR